MILIFILLSPSFCDLCPSPSINIKTSVLTCIANFNVQDCSSPQFRNCSISYCTDTITDQAGAITCNNYNTFTLNSYASCMGYCCKSALKALDRYQAVSSCSNSIVQQTSVNGTNNNNTLMIVALILGICCFILIVGFVLYKKCFKNHQIQTIDFLNPEVSKKSIKEASNQSKNQNKSQSMVEKLKWKEDRRKSEEIYDCAICLSEEPNLQLKCGHLFHPHCFREWLKKKRECAVCRGRQLEIVNLFCRRCFKKKAELNLLLFVKFKQNYKELVCNDCQP